MEKYEGLELEIHGHVGVLTLARPDLLNRIDAEMHETLPAALSDLSRQPEVRAIVLASTGKVFSAGGDFDWMQASHDDLGVRMKLMADALNLLYAYLDVPQPIVVGVQGAATGLGATLVLAGDAVVAARSAWLADTHVRMGIVAGDGGCLVWPQSAGMLRAKRYLLTCDRLDAESAFQMGLVTDLVDTPDEVTPAALALAERIAALPPLAVQGTKRALNRVVKQRAGEVFDYSILYETMTLPTDDVNEAIRAWHEKRPPNFVGR